MLKWFKLFIIVILLSSCAIQTQRFIRKTNPADVGIEYTIALDTTAYNAFNISVKILSPNSLNKNICFAKSIPGAYQLLNIGRYVMYLNAYDLSGKEISTEHININEWRFSEPEKVALIKYQILETWDTEVKENEIGMMSGTSLEKDHALLNAHAIYGFIEGKEELPIRLKLEIPKIWNIGTTLKEDSLGYFYAKNIDQLFDNPILVGNLSETHFKVDATNIHVYSYSKNNKQKASKFKKIITNVVSAAHTFMDGKLSEDYTFLFHFEDKNYGAHEHTNSSIYVFKEIDDYELENTITQVAAHEYMHLVTPLVVREKNINKFNFTLATPTNLLWFYEGVTEWASLALLYRTQNLESKDFILEFRNKLLHMSRFDPNISLEELSMMSFDRNEEYVNIYSKGAFVAFLFDIFLLENSNGKQGLRELMIALKQKYPIEKAFDPEVFYNDLVELTTPSTRVFIDNYIKGNKDLPATQYFRKLGLNYSASKIDPSHSGDIDFEIKFSKKNNLIEVINPDKDCPLKKEDLILKINGKEINQNNFINLFTSELQINKNYGVSYKIEIQREGKPLTFELKTILRMIKHAFEVTPEFNNVTKFKKFHSIN